MAGLDTAVKNGRALSDALEGLLQSHGYEVASEVMVGHRPGAEAPSTGGANYGRHRVDLVAVGPRRRQVAISVKYQGVAGTVEEKLPWEALSMKKLLTESADDFAAAYIVTGGEGFRDWLRTYFEGDVFRHDMDLPENLHVIDTDTFECLVRSKGL